MGEHITRTRYVSPPRFTSSPISTTPNQLLKDGQYAFPNDEPEYDRLDLQHHIFLFTLEGGLFSAPIMKEQTPHRVLDVGTGAGIWAVDFADEHPETEVIGVDLSPVQPKFVTPNLVFPIDDLEETWTFNKPFDFFIARMTYSSLQTLSVTVSRHLSI
jgi:SAM-dependent methyltransferase